MSDCTLPVATGRIIQQCRFEAGSKPAIDDAALFFDESKVPVEVILKHVRPVIKLRADQTLSCPSAPLGVLDGCRADVSFIAGMIIDKFAYHQTLYHQHVKLRDSGINVSRAWLTKLMPAAVSLIEPIFTPNLSRCGARA